MRLVTAVFPLMPGSAGVLPGGWEDHFNGRDPDGWDAQGEVDRQVKDALQFNEGRVEFRNIRIQKLGLP